MISDSWCNCNNILELKSFCSSDLEFLTIKCWPYYLPRELFSVIATAMYIPRKRIPRRPSRNFTGLYANWEPYILRLHLLYLGILTKLIWEQGYLKIYQHIDCSTRASNMHTRPSPSLLLANLTMTQSCCSPPIGRNKNRKCPCLGLVGLTNRIPRVMVASITRTRIRFE
jgi:hypothetical protein